VFTGHHKNNNTKTDYNNETPHDFYLKLNERSKSRTKKDVQPIASTYMRERNRQNAGLPLAVYEGLRAPIGC
jgi:hypothetical protein